MLNKISAKENKRRYLNLKGIATKHHAYKGPDVIQVDLTDRCNSHCILCWLHTPFQVNAKDNKNELDSSALKNFISDIAGSGTQEIIFSGGGEPFLYPKIWEVLEFTQKKGLRFRINTNLTLLNKESAARLLTFDKLASLVVSVWAGDPGLYSKIHNRDAGFFLHIKDNLKFINTSKPPALDVRIFTAVNNMNHANLRSLLDLAVETGCDALEFGVSDVIPNVTDSFLLNEEQLKFLKHDFINILKHAKVNKSKVKIINKTIFLKRISNPSACFGEYDSLIDKIPCYAGWVFLRLRANGDFNSCLKSHRIPLGNIYRDSFSAVWNNSLQQEFRKNSLDTPRSKEYFKRIGSGDTEEIGCRRICDNRLVNEGLHRFLKYLFWI